jgi:RNA polymerase sigma-70 factor (ECF subfamily)
MGLDDTLGLVRSALDGDEDARGQLLDRLRPRLVLWVASRMSADLRSKLEPDDMAQDILVALHKDMDRFDGTPGRAFFGWMFRVAENRIRDTVDHFGAQKRQPVPLSPPTQTSPSMAARRVEALDLLRDAIAQLPADYRRVVQLRRLEEREVPEIASAMDRSENAVRILYCRALKALRAALPEVL